MNKFELTSAYKPTGDQPEAIAELTEGVLQGVPAQTLLGVTGSGKTFTIANVIANINKPTLILSHNKTLAAQLYSEFKSFFPNNAVEYYVSYYDYYQPEAYLPSSDTYIEKDLAINDEIDKLRLAATSSLLSGRKDVVVVSSVSCIYGMGNPSDFYNNVIEVQQGKAFSRNVFLRRLVDSLYVRNDIDLNRGNFRVKGDTVDIYLAYADNLLRIIFWGDDVDSIEEVDPISGVTIARFDAYKIYPANLFMTTKEATLRAIHEIEDDLHKQVQWFENEGRPFEAKRLQERVTYDMEMIRELGHCSGIENYSRYFDGRKAGSRPYCLLDFFPEDFLIVIDESHVSVPQIRAMYADVFHTETALVRPQITCGTHALTIALAGNLRPGDELLSPVGKPYDTLQGIIGMRECPGSLAEYGISYRQVDLLPDGSFDFDGIRKAINEKTKLVTIQRSKGYDSRPTLSVEKIGELISFIKGIKPEVICMVDNCYGEFVETIEPSDVGADMVVGSLIKNPGGGLAPIGGYIAGKEEYVNQAAYRLTAPGLGRELGATLGVNHAFYQGFFLAPTVTAGALKGAVYAANLYEKLGYRVIPDGKEERYDIIQAVEMGSAEGLIAFCEGIQAAAPVDSFAVPEPWDMPGYDSQVIMAAGAFISGASIELSADGPLREPYTAFFQGGLTWNHARFGILKSLQQLVDKGIVKVSDLC